MKKISIIIPVYNVEKYLERCLDSVLNQSYKNLEIILINDGSTDNSLDICLKYAKKDNRIKLINQNNSGISEVRNKGLEAAKGEYIAFVDSDDVIDKDMFKTLYNNLLKYDSDISSCNYKIFHNKINFDKEEYYNKIFTKEESLKDIISNGVLTNFLWNKLFKKELFNNIKFPKNMIYEDMYVMPKIIEKTTKIVYTNQILYGYFQRENSYVNSFDEDKNKNYFLVINNVYNDLKKYNFLDKELKNYKVFSIYSAFLQAAKSNALYSDFMKEKHKEYKKEFKYLNKKVKLKRKLLYYLLYLDINIFKKVVDLRF
ncbi:MAG: glycosyltransferase [Bacilli bacterium]|nr:glycosyltransferase [Bacilli bacterium]